MYPKKSIAKQKREKLIPFSGPMFESTDSYHTFGYYVLGGLDITGEHTRLDNPVTFDSQDEIDSGVQVDALADPTTSFFAIAEEFGSEVAEDVQNNK